MGDNNFSPETKEAINRLDSAAYRMNEIVEKTGTQVSQEHAEQIMRSQLETIESVSEIISKNIGSGEAIEIADVSDIESSSSELNDTWD